MLQVPQNNIHNRRKRILKNMLSFSQPRTGWSLQLQVGLCCCQNGSTNVCPKLSGSVKLKKQVHNKFQQLLLGTHYHYLFRAVNRCIKDLTPRKDNQYTVCHVCPEWMNLSNFFVTVLVYLTEKLPFLTLLILSRLVVSTLRNTIITLQPLFHVSSERSEYNIVLSVLIET